MEEIIEDLNSRTIGPILLASFVSIVTLFFLQGTEPAFAIPAVESFNGLVYLAVPLIAAIASLAGVGFQKVHFRGPEKLERILPFLHGLDR